VTEDSKPVGSGRFREQTRDAEAVPGLFLALLLQHLPTSVWFSVIETAKFTLHRVRASKQTFSSSFSENLYLQSYLPY